MGRSHSSTHLQTRLRSALFDKMEDKIEEKRSKLESYKLRATLLLGTVCFICIFVFLLLIPLVLDPAISTLYHQFVEQPVHCKLTDYNVGVGRANCSWASVARAAPKLSTAVTRSESSTPRNLFRTRLAGRCLLVGRSSWNTK